MSTTHSFPVFLPYILPLFPQPLIPCMPISSHVYLYPPHARRTILVIYCLPTLPCLQLPNSPATLQSISYPTMSHHTCIHFNIVISSCHLPSWPCPTAIYQNTWNTGLVYFSLKPQGRRSHGQNCCQLITFAPSTPHSCSWHFLCTTTLTQHVTQVTDLVNQLQQIRLV